MKTGKTLHALTHELATTQHASRDFLAPARRIAVDVTAGRPTFRLPVGPLELEVPIRETAHGQIAAALDIPKAYYDRLRETAPDLYADNVRHWLARSDRTHFLRTAGGQLRAFLSDKYRPLDNMDLAEVVFPVLEESGFRVESCEVTERRMYVKAVTDRIAAEVRPGDVVQAGVTISNSEIGEGTLRVDPFAFFLVCTNGLALPESRLRKHHVGRGHGDVDDARAVFRDETRAADDRAFWLKVRDVVRSALHLPHFQAQVARLRQAAAEPIAADPIEVVEVTARRFRFTEAEGRGVLRHFLAGHNAREEFTRYGLVQAVTRASQDFSDYDRATEFEHLGGQILALPRPQWEALAHARG